jgi:hypothetical protein
MTYSQTQEQNQIFRVEVAKDKINTKNLHLTK